MSAVDCFGRVDIGNVIVGSLLTAGTFLAYVPQFGAIIYDRSALGVSVVSSFLNALCQSLLSLNGLIIQYPYFQCCSIVSGAQCNRLLLPYYQIVANGIGMFIVFTLVIAFFKSSDIELSWGRSLGLYCIYIWTTLAMAFVGLSMAAAYGTGAEQTLFFGRALGIVGGICGSLMYLPQIWQTYKNKAVGSLSIGTLGVQFPGSIAVIYYQLFINHLNWSIWVPNVLMCFFQGILLGMCIYYEVMNRWFRRLDSADDALLSEPS